MWKFVIFEQVQDSCIEYINDPVLEKRYRDMWKAKHGNLYCETNVDHAMKFYTPDEAAEHIKKLEQEDSTAFYQIEAIVV